MNKYLYPFIDHIGLYQLHKEKSKDSHFDKSCSSPIDMKNVDQFYAIPQTPDVKLDSEGSLKGCERGTFTYLSEVKSDHVQNDCSIGEYYIPANDKQNEPVSVILVHGWRMNDLSNVKNLFLNPFIELGYHMFFFTLPYHFKRTPATSLYEGEYMVSANVDRTLVSVKQAVSDLRALIRWIKEKRGGKVILIGLSLGGFITNLVSTLEEKIDMLISIMYANSIAYSVWHTPAGKYIKRDFMQHGFTYNELEAYWAITDPSQFRPVVLLENILLLSGMYDRYVFSEDTDFLWKAWGKPRRIVYPFGHAGIVLKKKAISKEVISFIQSRLQI